MAGCEDLPTTEGLLLTGLQPNTVPNINICWSSRCRSLVKHDVASKHHKQGNMMMMSLQLLEWVEILLLLVHIGCGAQTSSLCHIVWKHAFAVAKTLVPKPAMPTKKKSFQSLEHLYIPEVQT